MNKKGLNQIMAMVLLIFLVFVAVVAVLASVRTLTKSVETHSENLQAELEKPLKRDAVGCVSDWRCRVLGECEYVYGAGNVFAQDVFLRGEQSQSCADLNSCVSNYTQTQNCTSEKKVGISQVEKCSKNYIEIRDSITGNLVSRLELIDGKLNIDLVLESVAYCDFCSNGILDEGSEDYVDCDNEGEICPKCTAGMRALKFDYTLIIILVLFVVLVIIFYYLFLKRKQVKLDERKLRKKRIKGKKEKSRKRKLRKR